MAICRRCSHCQRIYEVSKAGNRGCPECSKKLAVKESQRRQQEDEGRKLYGSSMWRKCRRDVRLRYMDYDIWLMGIGIVRKCEKPYVHHIIERESGEGVFDLDNLITVSKESHEEIHRAYKYDRKGAMERIAKGIQKFNELVNDFVSM